MAKIVKFNNNENILLCLFASLISLVVVAWFHGWNYLHQIDAWCRISPEKHFEDILYFWKDGLSIGYSSPDFHVLLFTSWQLALLNFFKIFLEYWKALVLSQFMMYYLTVFFGIISAYLFFKELYITFFQTHQILENRKKLIIYALSILYIFNQYTLIYVFYRYTAWTLLWIAMPLTGYVFLKYLKTGSRKYFAYFGIITLLTPLSGVFSLGVLPTLLITWAIIWILLIFYNPNHFKTHFLRFFKFFGVAILLNSWVLIPQVVGMQYMEKLAHISIYTDKHALEYASQFTSVLNILRFLGYYVLYGAKYTYANFPYIWISILDNPTFQILTYIYSLVLSISLLLVFTEESKSLKRLYLLIFSAMLGLVLVMKGVNNPFPNTGYFLLSLNSVFFRHPYDRFVHLFAFLYFVVVLYLLHKVSTLIDSFRHFVIFLAIFIGIHSSLAYPLFTGDVIHPYDRINLSNTSYWSLHGGFKTPSFDFARYRVLVMPFTLDSREYSYNISGKIHHPNAKSLIYYAIPKIKVLQYPMSPQDNAFLHSLYYTMKTGKYEEFIDFLRRLNFNYIIFQKDATEVFIINSKNREIIRLTPNFIRVLEKKGLILKLFENENIALYEINYTPREQLSVSIPIISTKDVRLVSKKEIPFYYDFIFLENNPAILRFIERHVNYLLTSSASPLEKELLLNCIRVKFVKPIDNINSKNGWGNSEIPSSAGSVPCICASNAGEVPKRDQLNKFVWKDLGTFKLKKGEHKIILENIKGFNAVNFFALIPENEYYKAKEEVEKLLQNKTIIYLFEAESDLYRKNAKISKEFGGEASNGEVLKFVKDGEAWQDIEIVKNGTYRLALRGVGEFKVRIGNHEFILKSNSLNFTYTTLFDLTKGKYRLEILASKDSYLDVIWLYSTKTNQTIDQLFEVKEEPAEIINYTKINPTLWKVKVNATKPFMLSFAEAYDPLWEARVYKEGKLVEKVRAIPIYSVINGFWINETGELEIVIRYIPQDWFELGLKISGLTFIGCIGYLFYDWRREKGDKWTEKIEERTKNLLKKIYKRYKAND